MCGSGSENGCCEGRQDLGPLPLLHTEIELRFRRDDVYDLRMSYFSSVHLTNCELDFTPEYNSLVLRRRRILATTYGMVTVPV